MEKATFSTNASAVSFPALRLAQLAASLALVCLAALHVLSPELDPAWRMVSEYALGAYAWVLSLMFLAWAVSSAALLASIRGQVGALGGKIGLGLLLVSALGAGMAAFFDVTHSLHGLATLLGIPTLPAAAVLISRSLLRRPAWAPARRLLLASAHLTWISLALMAAMLFVGLSQTGGEFGPGVWIGWPNRLVILAYIGWTLLVAHHGIRIERR